MPRKPTTRKPTTRTGLVNIITTALVEHARSLGEEVGADAMRQRMTTFLTTPKGDTLSVALNKCINVKAAKANTEAAKIKADIKALRAKLAALK